LTGYFRLSENFRIPNADDNSNAATDASYNPIPLQVQTSRDIDVGVNHRTDVWVFDIAYFHSQVKNEIGYDPIGCGYGCNVNYEPTQRKGIHLRQKLKLSKDLALGAQLQHVDAQFVEGLYSGKTVPGVAALSGQLSLEYQLSAKEQLTLTTRFAQSRYMSGDFSNSQAKVPGYGIQDLSYFYKEKNWSVVASVANLFDKPYSDSGIYKQINTSPYHLTVYPNPGRSFSLIGRCAF
jgi:iron complex outermembrane receptor protein